MPEITIKGVEERKVQQISSDLYAKLAGAVGCSPDVFTIDSVQATYYTKDGRIAERPALVTVGWFTRSAEKCEEVARIIADVLQNVGVDKVTVWFADMLQGEFYQFGTGKSV